LGRRFGDQNAAYEPVDRRPAIQNEGEGLGSHSGVKVSRQ